nr:MAG TPA: hypothetical protein [Caudoviricetes sp.]
MFTVFRRFCKICPDTLLILDMAKRKGGRKSCPLFKNIYLRSVRSDDRL